MKTLTVTHDEYLQVSKFKKPLVVKRRTVTRALDTPVELKDLRTGEIVQMRRVEAGCGIVVGDVRRLLWRDDDSPRPRGGIDVVATSVEPSSDERWEVTFEVRPLPLGPEIMLAPGAGYTQNPAATIDDEAAVPYSSDVERVIADQQAAGRDRAKLSRIAEDVEAMKIAKRRKERIMREIEAALAELPEETAA
jgi:hypothetical protein